MFWASGEDTEVRARDRAGSASESACSKRTRQTSRSASGYCSPRVVGPHHELGPVTAEPVPGDRPGTVDRAGGRRITEGRDDRVTSPTVSIA